MTSICAPPRPAPPAGHCRRGSTGIAALPFGLPDTGFGLWMLSAAYQTLNSGELGTEFYVSADSLFSAARLPRIFRIANIIDAIELASLVRSRPKREN